MTKIVLVDQRQDGLADLIARQGKMQVETNFEWPLLADTVIGWLPDFKADSLGVQDLVDLVDRSEVAPAKIVMLSPLGTGDDVPMEEIIENEGSDAGMRVLEALFAVKMVDELELPYTVIRIPRLDGTELHDDIDLVPEGERIGNGLRPSEADVARVFYQALTTDRFLNQSIAVCLLLGFEN